MDEAGQPVRGATITPWGLGIWEAVTTWSDEAYGPPPKAQTNAEGIALVPYPVEVSKGNKTSRILFEVDHPQFCLHSAACFVRTNEFVKRGEPFVTLARGARLEISGYTRGTGNPASGMTADIATRTWKEVKPGVITTSRFPTGRVWLRLMLSRRKSPAYFSDVVELDLKAGEFRPVRVELKPGVRLEGRLDPGVLRPVHNGWASIAIVAKSAYDVSTKLDEQERLSKSKKTVDELVTEQLENLKFKGLQDHWSRDGNIRIYRDGSFVFPSLPEGEAGIVAGCDGYVSTDPMNAGQDTPRGQEHYVHRNAHHVALSDSIVKFTVPLEKTGTAEFKVIDPTGKPLSGATVSFCPNWDWQRTVGFLGNPFGTEDHLRDAKTHRKTGASFPNTAKSDANGIARVSNLPAGQQLYSVTHPAFSPPAESDPSFSENPGCSLLIEPGKISKHTSQMTAK